MGFDAELCIASDISPETCVILEKTRLGIPRLVEDIKVRVCDVMTRRVFYVYSAFVNELRDLMVKRGAGTVVVVDELGKLCGIVTRSDLVRDYRKRVALVDHNEFSQSIYGIEEAVIVAVVDHHRVSGDVETHTPIIYRIEPVGATNTIIWRIARERYRDTEEHS
ncbi:MAG TPA: CBS domain-containing protein [Ignisphaera sp.]|nr:CBS domain-containing protein [Ignisphaera sp.]